MLRRALSVLGVAAALAGGGLGACGEGGGASPADDAGMAADRALEVDLPPLPAIVGGLGSGCLNDEDCDDPSLTCSILNAGGVCTKACVDAETQAEEQSQCDGVGTTCLSAIAASESYCYRSCEVRAGPGEQWSCPEHHICTGWWWHRGAPDRTGCFPWCSDDAPCAPHRVCEPRMGHCVESGFVAPPGARRDGEPCSVSARLPNGRSADCLGDCFFVDDTDNGLCASFVDLARTTECPDDPSSMTPLSQFGDNVGICIYRECSDNDACTAPLSCQPCGPRGRCCLPP